MTTLELTDAEVALLDEVIHLRMAHLGVLSPARDRLQPLASKLLQARVQVVASRHSASVAPPAAGGECGAAGIEPHGHDTARRRPVAPGGPTP